MSSFNPGPSTKTQDNFAPVLARVSADGTATELHAQGKQIVGSGLASLSRNQLTAGAFAVAGLGATNDFYGSDGSVISRYSTPAQKLARLNAPPLGFNCFSILFDILNGVTQYNQSLVNYIAATAPGSLVRVAWPCFSGADWAAFVFKTVPTFDAYNNLSVPFTMDSVRPSFWVAADQVYALLEGAGLKILRCTNWYQNALPDILGETVAQGYQNVTSRTMQVGLAFEALVAQRYAGRACLGAVSYGNECKYDVTGATYPTPAGIGACMTALANVTRKYDGNSIITSDFEGPALNVLQTRDSLATYCARYKVMCAGLDSWGLHLYDNVTTYMGRNRADNAIFQGTSANDIGYEGAATLAAGLRAAAAADNKLFLVTECGVETFLETNGSQVKKKRLLRALHGNCDLALWWNVQAQNTAAGNQTQWYIDPTQPRATTMASVFASLIGGRPAPRDVGWGVPALAEKLRPSQCWTPQQGLSNSFVTVTSPAAPLQSATSYAVMFKYRSNAASIAAFEQIAYTDNATTGGGFRILGDSTAGLAFYADFRQLTSGSAGSVPNFLLPVPLGEWHHACFIYAPLIVNNVVISTTSGSNVMTVTSVANRGPSQALAVVGGSSAMRVFAPSVFPDGTTITALGTGTGGAGTYTMSQNATATATGVAAGIGYAVIDVYQDTLFLKSGGPYTGIFAPIQSGTTLKLGGGSSNVGGPLSLQDFAIFPSADMDTILAHARGDILNSALMHIRADSDGVVRDYARVASTGIALGPGCIVEKT